MDEFYSIKKDLNMSGFGADKQPEEIIIKGSISEVFRYTGPDIIPVNKTGKEIKDKLAIAKPDLEAKKQECYNEMAKYQKEAGILPTKKPSSYTLEPYPESKYPSVPNMYSWKEIDAYVEQHKNNAGMSTDTSGYEVKSASAYDECPMEKYNQAARKYIGYCRDLLFIDTLSTSLKDNQSYKLSIRKAASLGF